MSTQHKEEIICPNCKSVENAIVNYTIPCWTYFHCCENCGYIITESEWEETKESRKRKRNEWKAKQKKT